MRRLKPVNLQIFNLLFTLLLIISYGTLDYNSQQFIAQYKLGSNAVQLFFLVENAVQLLSPINICNRKMEEPFLSSTTDVTFLHYLTVVELYAARVSY